jgi:hypothetical protein
MVCRIFRYVWVGEGRPIEELDQPNRPVTHVRDMPGSTDAIVTIGMAADGRRTGWMARYAVINGEYVFEPETAMPDPQSHLFPQPWNTRRR